MSSNDKDIELMEGGVETLFENDMLESGKINTGGMENGKTKGEDSNSYVNTEVVSPKRLYYRVSDSPPHHLTLLFALQQVLMSVSFNLSVTLVVSEFVCARDDELLKTQILSASFMMCGAATFLMSTIGVQLPIFQGPSVTYLIPLLAMADFEEWKCPSQEELAVHYGNTTTNATLLDGQKYLVPKELIMDRLHLLQGGLMLAGILHSLVGVTGLVGYLLRFIGPITVVPAIVLTGLYLHKVSVKFAETHWGVATLTAGITIFLSLSLGNKSTPVPAWSRTRGLHIFWYPLHGMFALLISIVIGWSVSYILTKAEVLSDDPNSKEFYARTDSRLRIVEEASWLTFPYPGMFGRPGFHAGAFFSFLIGSMASILDSIGDYNMCSRVCFVPHPPKHAINRGIAVEGFMSFVAGSIGICHGTSSSGGNIGSLGITRACSRRIFQLFGLIFVAFAIFNKLGAVFITIPYSVIGGTHMVMYGLFVGFMLSNLQSVDMTSTRNLSIVGIALFNGTMIPYWSRTNPFGLDTGTPKERGLIRWDDVAPSNKNRHKLEEGIEIYDPPFMFECVRWSRWSRYIPLIPRYYTRAKRQEE